MSLPLRLIFDVLCQELWLSQILHDLTVIRVYTWCVQASFAPIPCQLKAFHRSYQIFRFCFSLLAAWSAHTYVPWLLHRSPSTALNINTFLELRGGHDCHIL